MDRTPCNVYPSLNRLRVSSFDGYRSSLVLGIDGEPNMSQACSPFCRSMHLSLWSPGKVAASRVKGIKDIRTHFLEIFCSFFAVSALP